MLDFFSVIFIHLLKASEVTGLSGLMQTIKGLTSLFFLNFFCNFYVVGYRAGNAQLLVISKYRYF